MLTEIESERSEQRQGVGSLRALGSRKPTFVRHSQCPQSGAMSESALSAFLP